MSPPDGAMPLDATARRLQAAARIRQLEQKARLLQEQHGHRHDTVAATLAHCAASLDKGLGEALQDRVILSGMADRRRERAEREPYYREMAPILDEAAALLRGLLPTMGEVASRGTLGANIIAGRR